MADNESIIEQVKAANPIEDVVSESGYPLPTRGRYRKCTKSGLGGLVVDVDKQIYHWYSRDQWGDVIAWVQQERTGGDFKRAVEELARRAHLPEPNWGNETQEQRLAARMQEEALDVAMRVFIRWLAKSTEAQAYLARRGWTYWLGEDEEGAKIPGTAVKAMLGYSGMGTPEERQEMRRAMQDAGVDLECPAAVAILGYTGNIGEWMGRYLVRSVQEDWVVNGRIPGMLGHRGIIYPHTRAGRVVYLSRRSIEGKMHYNLPEALIGKKQPFFNHEYKRDAEQCVVVEGQADGVSLGQWGVAGAALGGVQADAAASLAPYLAKHRVVYVGLDADKAGGSNAWKAADCLGPLVRMVNWKQARRQAMVKVDSGQQRPVVDADDLVAATAVGKLKGECPELVASLLGTLSKVDGENGFSRPGYWDTAGKLVAVETATDLVTGMRQVLLDPADRGEAERKLVRELLDWAPSYIDSEGNVKAVKDANDLLRAFVQAGMPDDDQATWVQDLLNQARTYVETVAEWAGNQSGAARDKALRQAMPVIARLSETDMSIYRKDLAKLLRVDVREMTNMLKAATAEAERSSAAGEPVYTWGEYVDGWLLEYLYDQAQHKAALAWRDPDGVIGSGQSVDINGRRYEPYPPNDSMKIGTVLFPSRLGEAKSLRELVAHVELYIKSVYLLPSDRLAKLVAYFIMNTWVYDSFSSLIYLRLMGDAGSGKSELMFRIGLITYRAISANGADSTSSLFRMVQQYRGTVLIDEADLEKSDTAQDMIKFLNLGAFKGRPILRAAEVIIDGQRQFQVQGFQTFCPKLLTLRNEFRDDAVASRSLTIKLQPRETNELVAAGIPLQITSAMSERAQALRNLLLRWRLETWQPDIEIDMGVYDLMISARLNQVAGPILMLAGDDPEQQEEIRKNLREYYRESILTRSMTLTARVIEAVWKIWKYPDLRKMCVRAEGDDWLIKIGDITRITNDLIDQMNDTGNEDDEDEKEKFKKVNAVKPQKIGHIIRHELQFDITEHRRDGFWMKWNEPRLRGVSMRYGVEPDQVGPTVETQKPEQGRLV